MARKWLLAVVDAIDSLAQMPERCPVVTEAHDDIECVRVLLHGNATAGIGFITACGHWARKGFSEDELQELMDEAD